MCVQPPIFNFGHTLPSAWHCRRHVSPESLNPMRRGASASSISDASPCTVRSSKVALEAVFDKDACVSAKKASLATFVSALLDTQHFSQFLTGRLQAQALASECGIGCQGFCTSRIPLFNFNCGVSLACCWRHRVLNSRCWQTNDK